jgi:hypothetical protein
MNWIAGRSELLMKRMIILIFVLLLMAGCKPVDEEIAQQEVDPNVIHTSVAATMFAESAQTAEAMPTDPPPPPTDVPTLPPPPEPTLPVTIYVSTPTPDAVADVGEDTVIDVPILLGLVPGDGQEFNVHSGFDAKWTFRNDGPNIWTPAYSIRFLYGANFDAPSVATFEQYADNTTVGPGEVTEILVPLQAPGGPGIHIANFCLYNNRDDVGLPPQCIFASTVEIYIAP